ncbi:hypothetical protein LTS18_000328, partial [Coniosporium uncinatum]
MSCAKAVKKMVKDSGILDQYPGVTTGHSNLPPDVNQLVQLADPVSLCIGAIALTKHFGKTIEIFENLKRAKSASTQYEETQAEPNSLHELASMGETPQLPSVAARPGCGAGPVGSRITTPHGQATVGGVVRWAGREYGWTVGHVFSSEPSPLPAVQTECAFECELDDDSDSDIDVDNIDEDFQDMTSRGSMTPDSVVSDESVTSVVSSGSSVVASELQQAFYGTTAWSNRNNNTHERFGDPLSHLSKPSPSRPPSRGLVSDTARSSNHRDDSRAAIYEDCPSLSSLDNGTDLDYALFELDPSNAHKLDSGPSIAPRTTNVARD